MFKNNLSFVCLIFFRFLILFPSFQFMILFFVFFLYDVVNMDQFLYIYNIYPHTHTHRKKQLYDNYYNYTYKTETKLKRKRKRLKELTQHSKIFKRINCFSSYSKVKENMKNKKLKTIMQNLVNVVVK